jgi:hypothetical protein
VHEGRCSRSSAPATRWSRGSPTGRCSPFALLRGWMGRQDIKTIQRYANHALPTRDAELVAAAFSRPAAETAGPGAGRSVPS